MVVEIATFLNPHTWVTIISNSQPNRQAIREIMDLANLIYFVIFSAIGAVLLIGAYKHPMVVGVKNSYLPISLAMFSVATCLMGLAPWIPAMSVGLVNFFLLGASLSQAFLYRAWRGHRSRQFELALWTVLVIYSVLFVVFNTPETFKIRVAIFTAAGFAIYFWKTYELWRNNDVKGRVLFLFIIVLMTLSAVMGFARFAAIYWGAGGSVQSLQSESVMTMAMKWGYYTIFLLNYIVIFSYYFQVTQGKEEHALKELFDQQEACLLLEQKKLDAEKLNTELRQVLTEKTNLLKAVTNNSKSTTLGVLASSIAHEINNPLCAVSLNLEMASQVLAEHDNATEITQLIKDAYMDCLRIQEVVDKLRKLFSREHSEFCPINLHELLQETCELFARELSTKQVHLQTNIEHTDVVILGDRSQLQMVMINLLTNAVDALSASTREKCLCISLRRDAENVQLSFEDNGCGVPEDQLAQIFEAHYSNKAQGMGMGLWLAKMIMENHSGSIHASNNPNRGARFDLYLKLGSS